MKTCEIINLFRDDNGKLEIRIFYFKDDELLPFAARIVATDIDDRTDEIARLNAKIERVGALITKYQEKCIDQIFEEKNFTGKTVLDIIMSLQETLRWGGKG